MERQIKAEEKYIETQRKAIEGQNMSHARRVLTDIKEGFDYLRAEKGLLMIAIYFLFSAMAGGAFQMLSTSGALIAELGAGALTKFMDERAVLLLFNLLTVTAAIIFIGGGRAHVKKIYNTSV